MKTLTLPRRGIFVSLIVSMLVLAGCSGGNDDATAAAPDAQKPNILFIVIDDFGLDQMTSYGYGGAVPPKTPNLTAIAKAGLQFRYAWAMPKAWRCKAEGRAGHRRMAVVWGPCSTPSGGLVLSAVRIFGWVPTGIQ